MFTDPIFNDPFAINPFTQQQAMDAIVPPQPMFDTGPMYPSPQLNPMGGQPTLPAVVPPPPQGGMDAFMNSPGLAMAAQASNNLSALNRGQVPRVTPVQAMQQAARQNQIIQMRRAELVDRQLQRDRQQELRDLQIQKAKQGLDPFFAWKQAKADGVVPEETSYEEFMLMGRAQGNNMTAQQKNLLQRKAIQEGIENGTYTKEDLAIFDRFTQPTSEWRDMGPYYENIYTGDKRKKGLDPDKEVTYLADAATTKAQATDSVEAVSDIFDQIQKIDTSIANIDSAIKAVNAGAGTGAVERFFPSIKAASIELDNIRNQMGLDIVGAGSFGALSESELAFALDTALPSGLDGPDLLDWLQRKRVAQEKLRTEFANGALFLNNGGTKGDLLERRFKPKDEDLGSIDGY